MRFQLSRPGLRTRTTLVAVAAVAGTLVLAGIVVVLLLGWSLDKATTEDARSAGRQVGNEIAKEGARDLTSSDVASSGDSASVIQVLDRTGRPIASDPAISGRPPLTGDRPTPGHESVETVTLPINGTDEDYRLVSAGVSGPGGPYTVISARSLDPVTQASARLSLLLGIAAVPLLAICALAVYRAVGSALWPVERMRRAVAEISTRDLSRRVDLPPGNDEIHRLATTLNSMLGRLASAQGAQRRFVADASHELRSPLNTITTALEVSAHHPDAMSADELLDVVSRETGRLRELVDDLLLLARTDDTTDKPPHTEVDLDDLARAEAGRARSTRALEVEIRTGPAKVTGNPSQLQRAIRNLVDNAAEHARHRVRVRTRTDGATAVVEVADDGPGVPPQDRVRIFERFVRRDDARHHGTGGSAGLGLAIVAGIAARHGGHAEYADTPDPAYPGAHFRIRLPLKDS
ncbi:HAMP domain-containing histidine kinase [Amycolatopsis acidiphila]|uniref:histidine kinase n=1 Tax=Amycolatopsis acidiphila TaxID=715473 RepID=A0A558AJ76_9PSEU|nr:HAMP domain-containing sensor histidine kinase [Amycolatopsis acidiphila]TVT24322.1 HAMP domain-containing histidine kinase [Amycolatopsis acidiphila]UIJ62544.1 HAMP domain-containing histidine kinase [Amycolatopsis acidiphila]